MNNAPTNSFTKMNKIFLLALFLGLGLCARAQDAVFVGHPESTDKSINTDDVKNILLGNLTKWRSGPVIKLCVLTDGPMHEKVIKDNTQRSADQFDKFWIRRVFTGNGAMPAKMKSDAEVIAFVATTPGAFGYVDKASVTDKVRVIPVN